MAAMIEHGKCPSSCFSLMCNKMKVNLKIKAEYCTSYFNHSARSKNIFPGPKMNGDGKWADFKSQTCSIFFSTYHPSYSLLYIHSTSPPVYFCCCFCSGDFVGSWFTSLCVSTGVYVCVYLHVRIHAWNEDGGTKSLCAILYDSLKTVVSCDIMNTGVSCGIINCDVLNTTVACNMKTNKCLTTFTFKHVCCSGITLLAAESLTWCTYMRQNTTTTPVHAQRTSGDACTPRTLTHISHPCI